MIITKIDDKSLALVAELGDRIALDVVKLENLIWLIRAEAIRQLAEVSRRYADAEAKSQTTPELATELHDASHRVLTLDKFFSQEVAMRNRAVQFGNLDERNVPGFEALKEVMERFPAPADTDKVE